MTKLDGEHTKILKADQEMMEEHITKYKGLQSLAGNDFWKNI